MTSRREIRRVGRAEERIYRSVRKIDSPPVVEMARGQNYTYRAPRDKVDCAGRRRIIVTSRGKTERVSESGSKVYRLAVEFSRWNFFPTSLRLPRLFGDLRDARNFLILSISVLLLLSPLCLSLPLYGLF